MNICIVSTYDCTFEEFEAVVTESQDEVSAFISEWELIKVNDHKSVMFVNCTDMDAMAAFMSTPKMQEWDRANNCVDTIYAIEKGELSQSRKPSFPGTCAVRRETG